jgi:phospho-N-acetylmuramoyl-pentapeptide-transferase
MNLATIALLVATLLTGALGLIDDASKVVKEQSLGLTPKAKLIGQFVISTVFILVAVNYLGVAPTIEIPFIVTLDFGILTTTIPIGSGFDIPWLYVIVVDILLMGMCNAVNLTDGLDGLNTGVSAIVAVVLSILAYLSGHVIYADYLNIMYIPDSGELAVFGAAFVGALIGFLWFNCYPAQVFMGDTGSLAIGGIIAVFALAIRKELLLPILCGIYLVEVISVMVQTFYFKYTRKRYGQGRRLFRMAPLHHHYQKSNIPENRIVVRFWIIQIILAAFALVTLKIR